MTDRPEPRDENRASNLESKDMRSLDPWFRESVGAFISDIVRVRVEAIP
jgi:hypothetical protein